MVDRDDGFSMPERNEAMALHVQTIKLVDGLDFGEGSISVEDRIDEEHHHAITPETLQTVEDAIHSPDILIALDTFDDGSLMDDDGCSDGRVWKNIFRKVGGTFEYMKRSLNRYKVFGGGATMVSAGLIGMGKAKGESLNMTMKNGVKLLKSRGIPFGAHTDDHQHGENCGCGAIDRAPLNVANAVAYRDNITAAIGLLTNDTDGLDEVFENFTSYAEEIKDQPYSGKQVMDDIIDSGKVVKQLEGPHLEVAIVINTCEGHTVNQDYIRRVSDNKAQVFGVDVPRLTQLAERAYPDSPSEQKQAFLSMLVYTLGTAATLTKGDLPVYVVSGAQTKSEALAA